MRKREREEDKEEFFPIFKKAKNTNIVGRILQQLDSNVPKVAEPSKSAAFKSKSESTGDSKSSSSGFAAVLSSLGMNLNWLLSYLILRFVGSSVGAGEKIKHLLPIDQRKNCDKVAAFAIFMEKTQNVTVGQIQNPENTPPFSDNKVLSEFFFTNI